MLTLYTLRERACQSRSPPVCARAVAPTDTKVQWTTRTVPSILAPLDERLSEARVLTTSRLP